MPTIFIDVEASRKEIHLSGDIAQLKAHRFACRYIKDSTFAHVNHTLHLEKPIPGKSKETLLRTRNPLV